MGNTKLSDVRIVDKALLSYGVGPFRFASNVRNFMWHLAYEAKMTDWERRDMFRDVNEWLKTHG